MLPIIYPIHEHQSRGITPGGMGFILKALNSKIVLKPYPFDTILLFMSFVCGFSIFRL
jgi:hypothetical protein